MNTNLPFESFLSLTTEKQRCSQASVFLSILSVLELCRSPSTPTPSFSLQLSLTVLASFSQLNFDLDRGVFPVVIQAMVDEGDGEPPFLFCSSSVWPLWEEATSPSPSPLSQQGRVYSKVMKNVGSAHLAGLGLWGSSTQLSISSQEPPWCLPTWGCGASLQLRLPSPSPTPSGKAPWQSLALTVVTAARRAPILVPTPQWNDGDS